MKRLADINPIPGRVYRIKGKNADTQDVLCIKLSASGHSGLRFCPIRLPGGALHEAVYFSHVKHDELLETWSDLLAYLTAHMQVKLPPKTKVKLCGGPCNGAEYLVDLGQEEPPVILVAWITLERQPGVALYSFPNTAGDSFFIR